MRRQVLVLFIGLGIVLMLSNCVLAQNLKIADCQFDTQSMGMFHYAGVEGVVQNVGSKTVSFATIKVNFYDSNNTVVGRDLQTISDLGPGEKWRFKLYYTYRGPEQVVTSYKIWIRE